MLRTQLVFFQGVHVNVNKNNLCNAEMYRFNHTIADFGTHSKAMRSIIIMARCEYRDAPIPSVQFPVTTSLS